MESVWRLLAYDESDGVTNMAVDEAILESHIKGEVPPTLRVYGFRPPAVTIGLSQKMDAVTVANITKAGFDVVRRPTGGRAVLHWRDLTYSFIGADTARAGGFLSTSVTESYRQICQGLIAAFAELGVSTELGASGVAYRHLQDCFMATTGCDLQQGGTKLIGSAQTRRRGAVLQHGSVPLHQDPETMPRLLGEEAGGVKYEEAGAVKPFPDNRKRHLNLFDLTGKHLSFPELQLAFQHGFEKAFRVRLVPGELTETELNFVEKMLACREPVLR